MNKKQIEINSSKSLEVTDLVIRKDSSEENYYRVQFILKNLAKSKTKVEDIELRMYDRTNHYIGHESCFLFEQYIDGESDEAFDINVDLPENFKRAELRIKAPEQVNSKQILFWGFILFMICVYGFAAKG